MWAYYPISAVCNHIKTIRLIAIKLPVANVSLWHLCVGQNYV
jgi:hypothetical protein